MDENERSRIAAVILDYTDVGVFTGRRSVGPKHLEFLIRATIANPN